MRFKIAVFVLFLASLSEAQIGPIIVPSGSSSGGGVTSGAVATGCTINSVIYVNASGNVACGGAPAPTWGSTAGKGLVFGAGTATTDVQALSTTQTWNNAAIAFTGNKYSIIDTASATGSLHSEWYGGAAGTTSFMSIGKSGQITIPNTTFAAPYGIIYKGTVPFIHNFNYGNNGSVTTTGNNTFVGNEVGNFTMGATATQSYHSSYNTIFGGQAFVANTIGFWNSAIGFQSLYNNTSGANNMAVGVQALWGNTTGYENVAIGSESGKNIVDGDNNTMIGRSAGFNGLQLTSARNSTAIGSLTYTTASNTVVIGNEAVTTYTLGNSVNAAPTAKLLKSADGITGTDIAGANLTIAGGRGTGTGAGGNRIDQTSRELGTGTTAQTLQDRTVTVAKAKALTAAAATQVVLINVASGAFGGGTLEYTVQASDGTDHQARAGRINWAVVNKAGTETCTVSAASELLDGSILAESAGASTLTYAITADTSATNGCYISFNAVSSLTETVLNIAYRITGNGGTSTFTAQ